MKKTWFRSTVATAALVAMSFSLLSGASFAATNIDGNQKYAEDNTDGGWVNLAPLDGEATPNDVGVNVTSTQITGKMWSENFGWIEMNPTVVLGLGDIACPVDYQLTNDADSSGGPTDGDTCSAGVFVSDSGGKGILSGKAWSEHIGWIRFGEWDSDPDSGVYIDSEGYFHGVAWAENFGAIAFGDYMLLNAYSNIYTDPTDGTDAAADKVANWAKTTWTPTPLVNAAPTASNVAIFGIPAVGQVLSGDYAYYDADGDTEGISTFRWLRADTGGGVYSVISGATSQTYTAQAVADKGKYIKFEVTPVASTGTISNGAVMSSAVYVQPSASVDDHSTAGATDDYDVGGTEGGTADAVNGIASLPVGVTNLLFSKTQNFNLSAGLKTGVDNTTNVGAHATSVKAAIEAIKGGSYTDTTDKVTINSGTAGQNVVLKNVDDGLLVEIPDGVDVYGEDLWDGAIEPPEDVTSTTAISNWSIDGKAVSVGDPGRVLIFDELVKITLPTAAGQPLYSVGGSNWVEVTTVCDDLDAPTNITFPGECYIQAGGTTIIHTYHAAIWADANPTNTTSANLTMTIGDGVLDVDIVDADAGTVASPTTAMTAVTTAFVDETTDGVLGLATQQIYAYNPTVGSAWSVTIAPTDGHTNAQWVGATDVGDSPCAAGQTEISPTDCRYVMDFNDPAAGAGQMSIDPQTNGELGLVTLDFNDGTFGSEDLSAGAVSGLSLPSAVSFDQGSPADITLINSTASAAYRIYRLQNVDLSQVVPAGQPADNYSINFTLTIS